MWQKPLLLVAGSVNMDLVCRMQRIPEDGESAIGVEYTYSPGGKGANQAVACAKLGAEVTLAGKVGADGHGEILRAALRGFGVSLNHLGASDALPTGLANVWLDEQGKNRIISFPGANQSLSENDVCRAFVSGRFDAALVQMEVPQKTVIAFCKEAERHKIPVILDAGPAQPFPLEKLCGVTILSPNETETDVLCGIRPQTVELAQKAAELLQMRCGCEAVILKLGNRGAYVYSASFCGMINSIPVSVVDTTAAGDAFTAAFALEYAKGRDIASAVGYANRVGALTVTRHGAMESLPTWNEVEQFSNINS